MDIPQGQAPQLPGPFVQGSCALHPGEMAMRTCMRCGNFMCDTCSEGRTREFCPSCRALVGQVGGQAFPLHRDAWTFDQLITFAWATFSREWVQLSLTVLVLFSASFGLNMISSIIRIPFMLSGSIAASMVVAVVFMPIQLTVQGVLQLGALQLTLDALQGKPIEFARMFGHFKNALRYWAQLLLISVGVTIPLVILAAVVGGILYLTKASAEVIIASIVGATMVGVLALMPFILPLGFANLELVHNEKVGVIDSLKNCYVIAKGQRIYIFLIFLLSIPIMVVGFIACFVGLIPAMAFMTLLIATLYLTLRNGAPLLPQQG